MAQNVKANPARLQRQPEPEPEVGERQSREV